MAHTTSNLTVTRSRAELLAWRNAVFVIFSLSGLSLATWVVRIPGVRDGLHLGLDNVGFLILAMSIGAILGLSASAPLLARLGARRGMVLSLAIVATGMVLVGCGSSFLHFAPVVALGLALLGFGNGSVDVMMNVEGAAAEREIGKTLMPLMHAFFSVGTVIGSGLGAAATALNITVAWHLIGMAVVVVIVAVIAVRYVPRREMLGDATSGDHTKPDWRSRLRENLAVWADWRLLLIGVVMLGMSFAEGSANDWLTLAVVDDHHQSDSTGAIVFGCFVAAMTVGRVLGGPVVDRIGRAAAIRATAAIGVAGLLLFILGGPLWLVIVGAVCWGLGASLGFPLGMSAAADNTDHPAARVSAVATIGYCSFLVGPPLIGILGKNIGLLNALYFLVGLLVLSALAAAAVRERRPVAVE
jgi:MFS family permease